MQKLAKVFFSFLLIFGLATRVALFGLIGTMLVAAFVVHSGDAFNGKELALTYLIIYGFLFFTGAGKYSLDYLIHRKMK